MNSQGSAQVTLIVPKDKVRKFTLQSGQELFKIRGNFEDYALPRGTTMGDIVDENGMLPPGFEPGSLHQKGTTSSPSKLTLNYTKKEEAVRSLEYRKALKDLGIDVL